MYGRTVYVKRALWEARNGPIPEGMTVHSRCGHRLCVNPEHFHLDRPEDGCPHGERKVCQEERKLNSNAHELTSCPGYVTNARTRTPARRKKDGRHLHGEDHRVGR
ncbi:MAG: HNH endonuclease [Armatimonadetes bacterium]|nr:HNH endonuclease [Armatimonadota bacterium]